MPAADPPDANPVPLPRAYVPSERLRLEIDILRQEAGTASEPASEVAKRTDLPSPQPDHNPGE